MIRFLVPVGAVLAFAACSSSGDGAAAHKAATAFRCPPAATVRSAVQHEIGPLKRSYTGSQTVLCAYASVRAAGTVFVSVTFGAAKGDVRKAVAALGGPDTTPVPGLGDEAEVFTKDGTGQLVVRHGDRLLTVTTDPADVASESAVARVFL